MLPDDYLTASDEMLAQANRHPGRGSDRAAEFRIAAQVKAIQAVAAAIDRLAAAVEALSPPSMPHALRACSRALLAGAPKALAQLARWAARRKISQLEEALEGAEAGTTTPRIPL